MIRTLVATWRRLVGTPPEVGPAGEAAEQEAARQRLLDQAAEQRGRPEGTVQRWTTVYYPPYRLTAGQRCAYRVHG